MGLRAGADDRQRLPGGDLERHPVEGPDGAVAVDLDDDSQRDQRLNRGTGLS